MKRFLVYLVWALFPIYAIATNYVVQVNTELNVRSKPKADAMCVGKLCNGTQVDVTTISEGWAAIDYNGNICYVTAKYLVPSGQGTPATSSTKKSATPTWKIVMWVVLCILGIVIFKYAFAILMKAITMGLALGGVTILICLLLDYLDIIEPSSVLKASEWGAYIGAGIGLIVGLLNPKQAVRDIQSPPTKKRRQNELESYEGYDEYDHRIELNQAHENSLSDFRDQDGNEWYHDSAGFHRK
jgi:uncharacterized protein YraI